MSMKRGDNKARWVRTVVSPRTIDGERLSLERLYPSRVGPKALGNNRRQNEENNWADINDAFYIRQCRTNHEEENVTRSHEDRIREFNHKTDEGQAAEEKRKTKLLTGKKLKRLKKKKTWRNETTRTTSKQHQTQHVVITEGERAKSENDCKQKQITEHHAKCVFTGQEAL